MKNAKQNWKQDNRQYRRAVNRAVRRGIATDVIAGRNVALLESIHAEIEPELLAMRKADEYANSGPKSLLENSPECYGQSIGEQQRKYGNTYRMATVGQDCDCELNEMETSLVSITTHGENENGRSIVTL